MRLAEMESKMLNSVKTEEEIDKNLEEALKRVNEFPDFK